MKKKELKAEIKMLKKEIEQLEFRLRFSNQAYELLKRQKQSAFKQGEIVSNDVKEIESALFGFCTWYNLISNKNDSNNYGYGVTSTIIKEYLKEYKQNKAKQGEILGEIKFLPKCFL